MAIAHPGLNSLKLYLKTRLPWHLDWECTYTGETFPAEQVVNALYWLKYHYPKEYEILGYLWLSYRPRNDIADALFMDASTLKRSWDKMMHLLKSYCSHGDLFELDVASYPVEPDPWGDYE